MVDRLFSYDQLLTPNVPVNASGAAVNSFGAGMENYGEQKRLKDEFAKRQAQVDAHFQRTQGLAERKNYGEEFRDVRNNAQAEADKKAAIHKAAADLYAKDQKLARATFQGVYDAHGWTPVWDEGGASKAPQPAGPGRDPNAPTPKVEASQEAQSAATVAPEVKAEPAPSPIPMGKKVTPALSLDFQVGRRAPTMTRIPSDPEKSAADKVAVDAAASVDPKEAARLAADVKGPDTLPDEPEGGSADTDFAHELHEANRSGALFGKTPFEQDPALHDLEGAQAESARNDAQQAGVSALPAPGPRMGPSADMSHLYKLAQAEKALPAGQADRPILTKQEMNEAIRGETPRGPLPPSRGTLPPDEIQQALRRPAPPLSLDQVGETARFGQRPSMPQVTQSPQATPSPEAIANTGALTNADIRAGGLQGAQARLAGAPMPNPATPQPPPAAPPASGPQSALRGMEGESQRRLLQEAKAWTGSLPPGKWRDLAANTVMAAVQNGGDRDMEGLHAHEDQFMKAMLQNDAGQAAIMAARAKGGTGGGRAPSLDYQAGATRAEVRAKALGIPEDHKLLESLKEAKGMLQSGNGAATMSAMYGIAKGRDPKGIVTDRDLALAPGIRSVWDKVRDFVAGDLSEEPNLSPQELARLGDLLAIMEKNTRFRFDKSMGALKAGMGRIPSQDFRGGYLDTMDGYGYEPAPEQAPAGGPKPDKAPPEMTKGL